MYEKFIFGCDPHHILQNLRARQSIAHRLFSTYVMQFTKFRTEKKAASIRCNKNVGEMATIKLPMQLYKFVLNFNNSFQ